MKLRIFFVTVLASLMLVSCSLAEDITPPPEASSPTSTSTVLPATRTPESTPEQPVITETVNPTLDSSTPQAVTPGATPETSPTAQITTVTINGLVTVASGAVLPAGSIATLLLYDTTAGQVIESKTYPILPDGKYEFTDVPANNTTAYFVTVDYKGITYNSAPALFDGTNSLLELPVVVYDSTEDMQTLTLAQVHLQFDFSTSGVVQVMELYVLVNSGETAVLIPTDGTSIPFIQIPEGALDVKYQLAQGSASLLSTANGFALLPGADKQYAIISTFTLPYEKRLEFSQPFNLPVTAAAVIVPEGVKVRSEQLTDGGTKDSQGSIYHLYQADSLASGSTLDNDSQLVCQGNLLDSFSINAPG